MMLPRTPRPIPRRIIPQWRRIPFPAMALAVCLIFAAVSLAALDDYGASWDTIAQRNITAANADYLMGDRDALTVGPLKSVDFLYGMAFELPLWFAGRALNLDDSRSIYLLRHLLTHWFFLAGGFCCALLVWRMFGSRWLALTAMLLFLLHPRLYAYSFFNTKDLPFASMFMITLYLTHRAFRKDTVGAFLLCGISAGLLINLRIMGVMLLPAILAMRGFDFLGAAGTTERRKALASGGVFVIAAALTLYAVFPYLWTNPLRFIDAFPVLAYHPTVMTELFQGEIIPSTQMPWQYISVWFIITTPLPALLLGGIGLAATAVRWATRPGAGLRHTELRFSLLAAALFIFPIIGEAALNSNAYDGWRQMYFLWAPFCLLSAAGLYWLTCQDGLISSVVKWCHNRWPRMAPRFHPGPLRWATYALAGIGVVLIIVELIQLHPRQYLYFNLLVDRSTPEYLRRQYHLDLRWNGHIAGLQYLLERYPTLPINVPDDYPVFHHHAILPEAERQRVLFVAPDRADFHLTSDRQFADGAEPPGPVLHTIKAYNNTVLTITAPGLAAGGPAALADKYQAQYQAITSGELLAENNFNAYLSNDGATLALAKAGCTPADLRARFFLNAFPQDENDLPAARKQSGYNAYRFQFNHRGGRIHDKCWVTIPLPEYPIVRFNTGQYLSEQGNLWNIEQDYVPPSSPYRAAYAAIVSGIYGEPAARSIFDVYRNGRELIYLKEPCAAADTESLFFLHLYPAGAADVPPQRQEYGFDSLDFAFPQRGARWANKCLAIAPLPDYNIARIRTGQYIVGGEQIWKAEQYISDGRPIWRVQPDYMPPSSPYQSAYDAILSGRYGNPAARSFFDIYRHGNELIYFKEPCAAADTEARFYLHLYPANAANLPAERREYDFDNPDFQFPQHGVHWSGKCLAIVPLPNYEIARIRTGQYLVGGNRLWTAEFPPAANATPPPAK